MSNFVVSVQTVVADGCDALLCAGMDLFRKGDYKGAMNILLVGAGGREHALAWKIRQSPLCDTLLCAPGNAGIAAVCPCVAVAVDDVAGLVALAKERSIDLVVVGPELPLTLGLVDRLAAAGILAFGPSQTAARLEGSKGFMKDLCKTAGIPTAAYERFTDCDAAEAFIDRIGVPIVVKADGLAAGKGVVVATHVQEAKEAVRDMLSGNAFGEAGASIVIEEFLDGEELSYFAISDGRSVLPFASAQDHKRAYDGDTGPNTGGMGAYSPARLMTPALEAEILQTIIAPTVRAMADMGCPFSGVLFAGIMVVDGRPMLLEFNARFGDPECQTLMLRLDTDLVPLLLAAAKGDLSSVRADWADSASVCVVMAAKGYPGAYLKNTPICQLGQAGQVPGVHVFHAGTAQGENGVLSTGGRVLGVCAVGDTLQTARDAAYNAVDRIDWPDGFCRRDIAWRAL